MGIMSMIERPAGLAEYWAAFDLDDRRPGESMHEWWQRKRARVVELSVSGESVREQDIATLRRAFEAHADAGELIAEERRRAHGESRERARALVSRWYAPRVVAAAMGDEQTAATSVVQRWIDRGKPRGLMLRGGVGVGKTVAAARWLAHELCAGAGADDVCSYRHDAIVGPVLHLYDDRNRPMPRYAVIDDVGRETKADFVEALCAVLDEGRCTLLMTSNLTGEQMRARYDARLIDRLNESCAAVDIAGASRRRQDGGF
jgi:DNA replication protein DnaC